MRALSDQSKRPTRLKALRVASLANAALLLILYLAETLIAECTWITGLAAYVPQIIFAIPLALLLVWSLVERKRPMLLANAAVAVLFVFAFLGLNVPLRSRVPSGLAIRVMTYNVHQGERGIRDLSRVIEDLKPDILCVQEVGGNGKLGDPVWQLMQLQRGWKMVRDGELAILSRVPITWRAVHYLPSNTGRAILEARVRIRGRDLTVLNTHFNLAAMHRLPAWYREPARERIIHTAAIMRSQAEEVLRVADSCGGSVVIAGDFNLPPLWRACRMIANRYPDAFGAAGFGFGYTFPAGLPVTRIDHMFTSPSLAARRCFVPRTRASDHRPVVADLILTVGG